MADDRSWWASDPQAVLGAVTFAVMSAVAVVVVGRVLLTDDWHDVLAFAVPFAVVTLALHLIRIRRRRHVR